MNQEGKVKEKIKDTDLDDVRNKVTLWTKPLVQVIDDGIWINDKLVWKNGGFFDVDGNHYVE